MLEQPCPNCGLPIDININTCPQCGQSRRTVRIFKKWHQHSWFPLTIGGAAGAIAGNCAGIVTSIIIGNSPDLAIWAAIGIGVGVLAAYGFILIKRQ